MRTTTTARRVLTSVLATTLLAGGVLLGQTVSAEPASAAGRVTCNVTQLRHDAQKERNRAAQLRGLGAHAEAKKAQARANALETRARQCEDADNNSKPPLWK